jgi:hypothetical protein
MFIVLDLTTLSVNTLHWMVEWIETMTWKSCEQQEVVACPGISFKWLRKTMKYLSVLSALAKVRTGKLPNTSVRNLAIILYTVSYKIHNMFS